MKNNVFYKSVSLYTDSEEKEFLEGYGEIISDDLEKELTKEEVAKLYKTDGFRNYLEDDNNIWYEEWNGIMRSLMENRNYHIDGELGLWYGVRRVSLNATGFDAILKCIDDSIEAVKIYEERGTLKIVAYHHDGTNYFSIKEITPKGFRSPHLMKQLEVCF